MDVEQVRKEIETDWIKRFDHYGLGISREYPIINWIVEEIENRTAHLTKLSKIKTCTYERANNFGFFRTECGWQMPNHLTYCGHCGRKINKEKL